jgi:hypothetical protein
VLPDNIFIPKLGSLYVFREDNKDYLFGKYGYHYHGLGLCVKTDIMSDIKYYSGSSVNEETYYLSNPLYCFEIYGCKQLYKSVNVVPPGGLDITLPLYLTLREANDMMSLVG